MAYTTYLLKRLLEAPHQLTYFAIGSCPHMKLEELNDRWDQVFPLFLREHIATRGDRVRVINIDPGFTAEKCAEYVEKRCLDLTKVDSPEKIHVWSNRRLELIFIEDYFYHENEYEGKTNHDWFLEVLPSLVISQRGKLVVHEFTGTELERIAKKIYAKSEAKQQFCDRILFDVSYGQDCSCGTDMSKYKPIYKSDGSFVNFFFDDISALIPLVGNDCYSDDLLRKFTIRSYKQGINTYHVDYRRRLRGDPAFHTELYTSQIEADDVMDILRTHILKHLPMLKALRVIDADDEIKTHLRDYHEYDVYKWYDFMMKTVQEPLGQ